MKIYASGNMINIEQNTAGFNGSVPKGTLSIDIEGGTLRLISSVFRGPITEYLAPSEIQDVTGTKYADTINGTRDALNAFFF